MIPIQAVKKCGFLRQIAEGAKKNASSFREALVATQGQIFSPNFQRGRLLVSTSGNGQSGNFELGVSGKEFTQDNVFGMLEEFIQLFDTLAMADSGSAVDTDVSFAAMINSDQLQAVRQMHGDFAFLGLPAYR